ncbi:unnamed protein product [Closterium sp. NIES-53]
MYMMTCTRPDLAYPLSLLARYVAPRRHGKVHWGAVKRVLRYLCSMLGMGLVLGGRCPVVPTGHADASWVEDSATQRSSQGYTFSLGSGSISWWSTRSSSVLISSCEPEIYAMAAQELRWLTCLLTDLGERPRSPPDLYVDNKAMIALCQEHGVEHRTKHIALQYFLGRELQQRGQLRLAYVATGANTADIFTKALPSCDHQRFCTILGLSVELSGPYLELVGCLMYLMTCTRPDLAHPLSILAPYVAPGRHQPEHWEAAKRVLHYMCSTSGMGLVLGGWGPGGSVSRRSTCSSFVLSSNCEAEIYAGAMAAQELSFLTYLLTDFGERPRSSPALYVDNKAMIALCQEHKLEHRTKNIALRYFLARELQQRGQLHLAYVATRANTTDIFTKALLSSDHQRFCTLLGLVPTLPHLLTA